MVKVGVSTKLGIIFSIIMGALPAITQIVGLVENVAVHWTSAEKTAAISSAAIAAIVIVSRVVQASIVLWRGGSA